jgi:hypothetical protein
MQVKPGNIGVITLNDDGALWVVDSVCDGLVYCHPLQGSRDTCVVMCDHFWPLIDSL